MASSIFSSVGLTICAALFTVMLLIIYIKKRSDYSAQSSLYMFLVILNLVLLALEVTTTFTMSNDKTSTINKIFCTFEIGVVYLWFELFALYLYILLHGGSEFKLSKEHGKTILGIVLVLFIIVPIIVLTIFDFEYIGGVNGMPYVIAGPPVMILHLYSFVMSLVMLLITVINDKKIRNIYVTPLYLVFIMFLSSSLLQVFFNYDINDSVFFFSLIICILYFTIESQDSSLLYEYRKSKVKAEKANKAKTEFLINMSHEIRTPMNTILGFSEIILNNKNSSEQEIRSDIVNINLAASSLLDLINNILDISSLESGEEVLINKDYYLENLIFEINSLVPSKINKSELKFSIDIDETLPKGYNGDANKIFKAVTYILLNAIEHTNYGEVKLHISGTKINEEIMEFEYLVSNTGHAMTVEEFSKNFDDFVKLDINEQSNSKAKLGLIIAKQLVNILQGKIDFINEKGQGTKYIIKVRQRIVDSNPIGNIFETSIKTAYTSSRSILDLKGKKCLIVDDSEVNIKLAVRLLQQYKLDIDTVNSGKDCVEKVKNNHYDIVFLDHMMPDMDGSATMRALNLLGTALPPIIALTANSYEGLKERFINEGFNDYLQKPLNFKELNKTMHSIFDKGGNDL